MHPDIPESMTRLVTEQYGETLAEEISAGLVRHPVTLRVNTLRTTVQAVCGILDAAGIRWEPMSWYPEALLLPDVREEALRELPLYEDGSIYLQGLSAMLPALLLDPQPGEAVLDMCAAPGGKTTQMAAMTGGKAQITACEKNKIRADRLRFNLDRQGCGRVGVMNTDARQLDDFFSFDRILLDAPCTGSGTILLDAGEPPRRMDRGWIDKTAATQKAMLRKALRLLKPGHEMVYSTCSILRNENEEVLRSVLTEGMAEIVPAPEGLAAALPTLPVTLPGTVCVKPTVLAEGFFMAKLRKRKK